MLKKLTAILLTSIMVLSGTVMSFAEEISPRGEADCIYGTHRMRPQGSVDIYDSNDNARYRNYMLFQCGYSRCETYFASENDPAAWNTIGNYFINPEVVFAFAGNHKAVTDATPLYKKYTPLDGFNFQLTRDNK